MVTLRRRLAFWKIRFARELRSDDNMFLSLLLGRWLVLLPPLVALLWDARPHVQRTGTFILGAALASNIVLSIWHRAINAQLMRRPFLLIFDMLLVAACMALTGGTESPYFFYALTPMLAAAFFFQVSGGLVAALAFTPLYLGAAFYATSRSGTAFNAVEALAEVLSFYGIAVVFGYSSVLLRRLRKASVQLQRTQDELGRAETLAALGKMLAHVSHEIRNPLTALGGYAHYIARKPDDPESVRRHALIISESVMKLEELLTDLLDLTRRGAPKLVPGDLHEVLDEAWQLSGSASAAHPVTLRRNYCEEMPAVNFDRSSLLRAFLNVMRNAVQMMPQGGALTVTTRVNGEEAEIEITDSGPGIPPDVLPTIFTPFVTHREHGTGLGLAVVHEIAQQHGGRVVARSEDGQGATFVFTLPLAHKEISAA